MKVRWTIFLFLCGFAMLSYVQRTSLGVAAQNIMPDLHLSQMQIGWLNAAFATCYALAQIAGRRPRSAVRGEADLHGRRPRRPGRDHRDAAGASRAGRDGFVRRPARRTRPARILAGPGVSDGCGCVADLVPAATVGGHERHHFTRHEHRRGDDRAAHRSAHRALWLAGCPAVDRAPCRAAHRDLGLVRARQASGTPEGDRRRNSRTSTRATWRSRRR